MGDDETMTCFPTGNGYTNTSSRNQRRILQWPCDADESIDTDHTQRNNTGRTADHIDTYPRPAQCHTERPMTVRHHVHDRKRHHEQT
jgi:hypothetical protein